MGRWIFSSEINVLRRIRISGSCWYAANMNSGSRNWRFKKGTHEFDNNFLFLWLDSAETIICLFIC